MKLIIASIISMMSALPDGMAASSITEGEDYWRIQHADESTINRQHHLYFSWYGCQSCRLLEQQIGDQLAELEYVPLIARPEWRAAAKLHYTMQLLELSDQQKAELIQKIDKGELDVTDFAAMQAELLAMGVDEEVLTELLENKELYRHIQRAEELAEQYEVRYAPTVVIGGQFATDANHTMKVERFAEVLRHLKSL